LSVPLVPAPLQAPEPHPFHVEHSAPLPHCESLVHQQGVPAAVHVPVGEDTVSQLPAEQDHASAVEVAVSHSLLSCDAVLLPVQVPVHWLLALTHLPLEQSPSATQRHAVPPEFNTGAGKSDVVHPVPPEVVHATELGAATHPFAFAVPDPVQFDPQAELLTELGTHFPLSHWLSFVQKQAP
jgi:hypothetical protein